jgi:ABC-type transport system involved in Fe-S cluster assembly fused permease/ATPase subunit
VRCSVKCISYHLRVCIVIDGVARATSSLFNELRSAVFSAVAQDGIRRLARQSFVHLHSLDLKFHLNRNTGALSRAIDRGIRYIMPHHDASSIISSLVISTMIMIMIMIGASISC